MERSKRCLQWWRPSPPEDGLELCVQSENGHLFMEVDTSAIGMETLYGEVVDGSIGVLTKKCYFTEYHWHRQNDLVALVLASKRLTLDSTGRK